MDLTFPEYQFDQAPEQPDDAPDARERISNPLETAPAPEGFGQDAAIWIPGRPS